MSFYDATVLKIDEDIEEQVLLGVQRYHITCFASVCPYPIKVGEKYRVKFYLFVADEFCPNEVHDDAAPAMTQDGNGFRYNLIGKLTGNILDCGIKIEDDVFTEQYGYLNGKKIKVSVDRLDVEFL